MLTIKRGTIWLLAVCLVLSWGGVALAAEQDGGPATKKKAKGLKAQETCPITGKALANKDHFVDRDGYRIYVTSEKQKKAVEKNVRKALRAILKKGEKPEIRLALCQDCGEIKGTTRWRFAQKQQGRFDKDTGLVVDSPGYQLHIAGHGSDQAQKGTELLLDPRTGEILGSARAKNRDLPTDPVTSLHYDSPGYYRLLELNLAGVGSIDFQGTLRRAQTEQDIERMGSIDFVGEKREAQEDQGEGVGVGTIDFEGKKKEGERIDLQE